MQNSPTHKTKQFFALVIKLFIVIACVYFLITKLSQNNQLSLSEFLFTSTTLGIFKIENILLLGMLSTINWFFEILKWQTLLSVCKKTSFTTAFIQSLSSFTVSLITPNRVGEYGAKAMYFERGLRKKILVLNLVGNLYQLLATIIFGSLGIGYLLYNFSIDVPIKGTIIVSCFAFLGFILARFVYKKGYSIKGHSLKSLFHFIHSIPKKVNLKVGIYASIRYLVFSHQFYFLLLLFQINISYEAALFSIFSMYLLSSIIPMYSLFDVVVKGSIAIWVFSFFNGHQISILSIVLIMWLFNVGLPSIVGSYFVLTFKTDKLIHVKK